MQFRLIFFSFAKWGNKGEVAGHENMTLTRRMAHARIELHKKLSFNDIHPMTVVSTFSVSHFHMFADHVSLTHLALIFLTHLAELVSLTHLALGCLTHLADLLFDTFSVDLTHLAELTHLA